MRGSSAARRSSGRLGLSGFCPGPALVSLFGGGPSAIVFVLAMLGGTAVTRMVARAPRQEFARVIAPGGGEARGIAGSDLRPAFTSL